MPTRKYVPEAELIAVTADLDRLAAENVALAAQVAELRAEMARSVQHAYETSHELYCSAMMQCADFKPLFVFQQTRDAWAVLLDPAQRANCAARTMEPPS